MQHHSLIPQQEKPEALFGIDKGRLETMGYIAGLIDVGGMAATGDGVGSRLIQERGNMLDGVEPQCPASYAT